MENNNPSRHHRSDRWARLKKQLTKARVEVDAAKRQRDWAHLFISSTNQWQEFNRWLQEQLNNDVNPSDSVFTCLAKTLNTAQAEAEQATQRLTIAQKMGEICKEQAEGNYNMVGRLSARVDSFLATVDSLIARVIEQQEEITTLKEQLQNNDTPEGDTANLNPSTD